MQKEYVKRVEGAYRVGGTRVSLDSHVYLYREEMSAVGMVECYSALTTGAMRMLLGLNGDSAMPVVVQAFYVEDGVQFRLTRSKEDTGLHGLI